MELVLFSVAIVFKYLNNEHFERHYKIRSDMERSALFPHFFLKKRLDDWKRPTWRFSTVLVFYRTTTAFCVMHNNWGVL